MIGKHVPSYILSVGVSSPWRMTRALVPCIRTVSTGTIDDKIEVVTQGYIFTVQGLELLEEETVAGRVRRDLIERSLPARRANKKYNLTR